MQPERRQQPRFWEHLGLPDICAWGRGPKESLSTPRKVTNNSSLVCRSIKERMEGRGEKGSLK